MINQLEDAAFQLAEYMAESEWELLEDEFAIHGSKINSFEEFVKWVKGYMYYNIAVCSCGGDQDELTKHLNYDYELLQEG